MVLKNLEIFYINKYNFYPYYDKIKLIFIKITLV